MVTALALSVAVAALLAVGYGIFRAHRQNAEAERIAPAQDKGRHRRDDARPGAVTATGILRAVNAQADLLPAIPRGRPRPRR